MICYILNWEARILLWLTLAFLWLKVQSVNLFGSWCSSWGVGPGELNGSVCFELCSGFFTGVKILWVMSGLLLTFQSVHPPASPHNLTGTFSVRRWACVALLRSQHSREREQGQSPAWVRLWGWTSPSGDEMSMYFVFRISYETGTWTKFLCLTPFLEFVFGVTALHVSCW